MHEQGATSTARKALGLVGAVLRPRPTYVIFQVTRRCNLLCDFCDFHRHPTRPTEEIGVEQVEAVSERLAEMGPCVVCVSGGEPTVRTDLPDLTRALAKRHFPTLITNGWFMTPQLAEQLFESGFAEISVSVDYASAEQHDARRGIRGSWDRAISAVAALRQVSAGFNQRVYMNAVLLDDNLGDIEPLLQLSERLGVTFRLSLYSPHRGQCCSPKPGLAERLLALKRQYPHFVSLSGYLRGIDSALSSGVPGCQAGKLFLFIDAAGGVFRCVEQQDAAVGNILTEPWAELTDRLAGQAAARPCAGCWTSTRGSTEAVLHPMNLRAQTEFLAALSR